MRPHGIMGMARLRHGLCMHSVIERRGNLTINVKGLCKVRITILRILIFSSCQVPGPYYATSNVFEDTNINYIIETTYNTFKNMVRSSFKQGPLYQETQRRSANIEFGMRSMNRIF